MPQSTGILLVAAFAVFLVGAGFWLVREFEKPLEVMLRGGPFAPPIVAHSFGLLAGIVLLLRS